MDSEKHKHILETIRLSLESTVVMSPEDLMVIDTFVERHATIEGSLPIPKFLLSHLLEDEKSHDTYMEELTKLKAYMAKDTD
jgi:hypothetical protein